MNPYATHREVLLAALWHTGVSRGAVLECGAGDFSTPLLHEVCAAQGRKLVTLETDPLWLLRFSSLASPDHELALVADWAAPRPGPWDVAFVDCDPPAARGALMDVLVRSSRYVVAHDTEPASVTMNNYRLERFKYRRDFIRLLPNTSVVSDTTPIWPESVR